jgi:hypothetical protein
MSPPVIQDRCLDGVEMDLDFRRIDFLPRFGASRDSANRTFHPDVSVLPGETMVPFSNSTGLFFEGPIMPAARRCGADHVFP